MRLILCLLAFTALAPIGCTTAQKRETVTDTTTISEGALSGAATGAAAGGVPGAVIGGAIGLISAILGIVGGKMHSKTAIVALQATNEGLQAANDAIMAHKNQLAEGNSNLAAKLDTAHDMIKLAIPALTGGFLADPVKPVSPPSGPIVRTGAAS